MRRKPIVLPPFGFSWSNSRLSMSSPFLTSTYTRHEYTMILLETNKAWLDDLMDKVNRASEAYLLLQSCRPGRNACSF